MLQKVAFMVFFCLYLILCYFLTKLNNLKNFEEARIDILSKAYIKLKKEQSKKIIENYHKIENIKQNQIQDFILALSYENTEEIEIRKFLKIKYENEYNDYLSFAYTIKMNNYAETHKCKMKCTCCNIRLCYRIVQNRHRIIRMIRIMIINNNFSCNAFFFKQRP